MVHQVLYSGDLLYYLSKSPCEAAPTYPLSETGTGASHLDGKKDRDLCERYQESDARARLREPFEQNEEARAADHSPSDKQVACTSCYAEERKLHQHA